MCGISGFLSLDLQRAGIVYRMSETIRHRGPDDEGFALFPAVSEAPIVCGGADTPKDAYESAVPYAPNSRIEAHVQTPVRYALAHRRLSIVDVSPLGHQPLCSPDRRYWIVFNGEVYNHIELRAELEILGHRFVSHTDTEVILAAYAQWGPDCLHRFNGMWALAIIDTQEHQLFLARDRFGVKPLYYWISPQGMLAFASEIKQFTTLPGWHSRTNGQRVYDFLVFGLSDHTPETMFDGVYQVPPGNRVMLSCDTTSLPLQQHTLPLERWYALSPAPFQGSYEHACEGFRDKFEDAVALRLRADVRVGSCLSGGLDSSSIVCAIDQLLTEKGSSPQQKTFSACSDVQRFDERNWIDIVVGATGVDASYVYPSIDALFEESPRLCWHQDEPFGSTSIFAQWNVFRLASEHSVKVMLDGQGADEQLAGYHSYFGPMLVTLFREFRWLQLYRELRALKRLHGYGPVAAAEFMAKHILPDPLLQSLRARKGLAHARPNWLDMDRLGAIPVDPFTATGARGSLQSLSLSQLTASNLPMLLHWEDRNSMAHSIESRVPFLDYRLVEFVLGLPDEFKLSTGITKRVLRDALSGILPNRIRDRIDKLGFVTPEEVWLRERAPDAFRAKLNTTIDAARGVLHAEHTRAILEDTITGARQFDFLPWRLVSFGEWLNSFDIRS